MDRQRRTTDVNQRDNGAKWTGDLLGVGTLWKDYPVDGVH